jgi:hypothetical protein
LTPVVLDALAGVELALRTPVGRRLGAQMPGDATIWVPEHFYAESAAVLRRIELNQHTAPARVQLALGMQMSSRRRRLAWARPSVSVQSTDRHVSVTWSRSRVA